MCSTTVHQGVKDINHSYQKRGRMNEESKGRMGLTPSNTKPSNKDWASPAQADFFKKLFLPFNWCCPFDKCRINFFKV